MSRSFCRASGALCVLVVLGTVGRAQGPGATSAAPATLVAVVDIAKVFETHPTFKANLEALQQQATVGRTDRGADREARRPQADGEAPLPRVEEDVADVRFAVLGPFGAAVVHEEDRRRRDPRELVRR